MKSLFLGVLVIVLSLTLVSAGSTCLTLQSKTTSDYLNELSSLNDQLSSCDIILPSSAGSLIKNGNVLVSISMDSGSVEQFYVSIVNLKVSSLVRGVPDSYTHEVLLSEMTFDKILQSDDAANEVLAGVNNKNIKIKASSFGGKIKLFFAKFFLPKPSTSVSDVIGKPENCDETYLQGHKEYSDNKELWDSYSADSDKVCQSQYGKGIPSPCVHSVQLSISGNPYYLCWYNE